MIKRLFTVGLIAMMTLFVVQACAQSEKEKSSAEDTRITASEFQDQIDKQPGVVIDVRTQDEYDQGHVASVDYHLDLLNGDFESSLDSLDKDKTYYLYCRTGNRSGQAADLMRQKGFENIYNIGGFQDLVDAGVESKQ
ncbi:rhodanese-like domain-containing protein [Fodinibius sp.]|uniref:rhodanese-like domain-containing protein n=1 Tax=Fodinibius sp. TaxID=1872440 RepID=UPI002ACDBB3B|nr:rhodanese-like domain-containing protein [Fodinibius sp.]MDZ7658301.1 rhodanese-like domain-containing protein [Fodinibius sp.]